MYSHVIGDRKLLPGETLNKQIELPVESAANKDSSETK
jgi:hypothetical protein